ncbi:MAG: bifunctional 2-polyprenyl-6-hydroxyphenol methylase/3-demethylubiquinol 3-O-methyltransferase UbiG [Magnetococcales bacterium]|nr:bifunctional 2-polyprenyl-6-hydroxyphenol methylase/3-demethylubiquinol 3-O-methyltransferase UbiG [Magnetococcales bacterium]
MSTVDQAEIAKFEQMAHEWWEPEGKFKPLHEINPVRLEYIQTHLGGSPGANLSGLKLLDIGCGGGILSESLFELGANVTAIDRSDTIIGTAKAHQKISGSNVDYRMQSAGQLSEEQPEAFDAVMIMEVLEHVPDVAGFLQECERLVKPGGKLFFATLNKTWKSWLYAIVGAEYILRWLPRGTHEFDKFVRPSELEKEMREIGIKMRGLAGISYDPLRSNWKLSTDTSVNFLGFGEKQTGR